MTCEHLICARCSGHVVDGRCATCRAARAEIHHPTPFGNVSPLLIGALILALTLLIALKLGLH
jgi:hypothetical protein